MSEPFNPLRVVPGIAPAGTPIEKLADEELMLLAAGGYRQGFETLVNRYLSRLTSYCTKFSGGARAGEDIAQEVLLDAWGHRARYRPTASFAVFLFSLARNRCLNHVRDTARRARWIVSSTPEEPLHDRAAEVAPDQLAALLKQERQRVVRAALLDLAPKSREVLLLRFDQGLGYAEISRIVGSPEGTVRSRVFHAIERLRSAVTQGDAP